MASHYMTKNEEKEMLEAFQALDLDGNGVLTVDELIQGNLLFYRRLQKNVPSDARNRGPRYSNDYSG